jgi:hypoxanthine phosphoribosyltransferase/molybdopterin converting factor small subunit
VSMEAKTSWKVRIRLLASLKELADGKKIVEIEAEDWRDALIKLREKYPGFSNVIDEKGVPKPGYIVFIDGIDYRIYKNIKSDSKPKEIVLLPVNHGGIELEYVSWDDIEEMVREISDLIVKSGYKVDVIVGILRGGIIPAKLIADELGVDDLGAMEIKLYKRVGERAQKPYIRQPLTLSIKERNVLIVDDVSDTGLTLSTAINALELYSPKKIRTATLYIKPWTKLIPDYYSRISSRWIVFPWERKEVERELGNVKH